MSVPGPDEDMVGLTIPDTMGHAAEMPSPKRHIRRNSQDKLVHPKRQFIPLAVAPQAQGRSHSAHTAMPGDHLIENTTQGWPTPIQRCVQAQVACSRDPSHAHGQRTRVEVPITNHQMVPFPRTHDEAIPTRPALQGDHV